jgi:DNA modification methylase
MYEIKNESCLNYPIIMDEFDHVITDPPYSSNTHKKAVTQNNYKTSSNNLGFSSISNDIIVNISERIYAAKSWCIVFCDWQSLEAWKTEIEKKSEIIRVIPWVRWSVPVLTGDRPPSGFECIILAHNKRITDKKTWNGPGNLTHFSNKCMRGSKKHKTQKPLDLMLEIVEYFTNLGSKVIDPCMGSGTTLKACELLDRDSVGLEIQPQWCESAEIRMNELNDRDMNHFSIYKIKSTEVKKQIEKMKKTTAKARQRADAKKLIKSIK